MITSKPDFFIENKVYGNMARFKKIQNPESPMAKKLKLMVYDFFNFAAFGAVIAYCLFSIVTSGEIIKKTYDITHELFHVEP